MALGEAKPHHTVDDHELDLGVLVSRNGQRPRPDRMSTRWFVATVTALLGVGLAVTGVWCLTSPASFADAVRFPPHVHFVHDLGAYQLAVAATLLLALIWRDALATVLTGFLVGNTVHAVNHARDVDLGGRPSDAWALAAVSVLITGALALRLRQLGYVVGDVGTASAPAWMPFVRQKTVLLTTYRRDGTPVATPVSIAVDGDRAVVRSFEKAGKTRRLRRNATLTVAPSTARGRQTGPAVRATARRLDGTEYRAAGRMLARKHPFLHGFFVPFGHRVGRAKTGRTVHFELTPVDARSAGT